jgi:hypothetical protein
MKKRKLQLQPAVSESMKKIASSIPNEACVRTVLVLAFLLTLVSSAGAQFTPLYNFVSWLSVKWRRDVLR